MALYNGFLTLLVGLLGLGWALSQADRNTSTPRGKLAEFLEGLVSHSEYDSLVHPHADEGRPTVVEIDLFLNSISSIDEAHMEYSVQIFLRQRWIDQRLAFDDYNHSISLDNRLFGKIWIPDLFVSNEKEGRFHELTVPNRLIEIFPSGEVLYSLRLSFTLWCDMNLEKFPMDNQTCSFQIESYAYTTRDIIFKWNPTQQHVTIRQGLLLPEFEIEDMETGECQALYSTGEFTCLFLQVHFQRQFAFYLSQTFIPSILIVMLSWVSFWIDSEAVPARVSLGLLTVLTMTTQTSGSSIRLPRVSYIKAIDIWMTVCLAFVFGALIEFSVVNVLSRKRAKRLLNEEGSCISDDSLRGDPLAQNDNSVTITNNHVQPPSKSEQVQLQGLKSNTIRMDVLHKKELENHRQNETNRTRFIRVSFSRAGLWCQEVREDRALMLDVSSRILFPLTFVLFNVFYWVFYLLM